MSLSNSFLKNTKTKRIKSLPKSIFLKVFHVKREAPRCTCLSGVLTVEAALAIPCLICFFVSILFFFRVLLVQLEVQQAVDDTARRLAVYMAVDGTVNWKSKAAVKALLMKELSHSKYADTYIKGGIAGIGLSKSDWSGKDVDLRASCRIRCPIQLFGILELRIESEAVCRKWIGWGNSGENGKDADVWVYIAETGTAYHKTDECTHLMLSIQSVEESILTNLRNETGGKYKKCTLCAAKVNRWGKVYITNQGDRYHYDLNCSGIKRTVSRIRLSETGGRSPCSRCKPPKSVSDMGIRKDRHEAGSIAFYNFSGIGISGLQKKNGKSVSDINDRSSRNFHTGSIQAVCAV